MAASTKLLEYRERDHERLKKELAAEQKNVEDASAAEAAAKELLDKARKARDENDAELKRLKGEQWKHTTHVDRKRIVADISKAELKSPTLEAEVFSAELEWKQRHAESVAAGQRREAVAAWAAEADSALKDEKKVSGDRLELVAAVTREATKRLPDAARKALAELEAVALARLDDDFSPPDGAAKAKKGAKRPKKVKVARPPLLKRILARYRFAAEIATEMREVALKAQVAREACAPGTSPEATKGAELRRAFDEARGELVNLTAGAILVEQGAEAIRRFGAEEPKDEQKISQERDQKRELAARDARRDAALKRLAARDESEREYYRKRAKYEKELFKQTAARPQATDEEIHALKEIADLDVDTKRALTDLQKADEALDASDRKALAEWLAAVPDDLWQKIERYEAAKKALDEVAAKDADDLVKRLLKAEGDLIAHLQEAAKLRDRGERVRREFDLRLRKLSAEHELGVRRRERVGRHLARL